MAIIGGTTCAVAQDEGERRGIVIEERQRVGFSTFIRKHFEAIPDNPVAALGLVPGKEDPALDDRLTAWHDTYQHWLTRQLDLSDEQTKQVSQLIQDMIAETKKGLAKRNDAGPLYDSTVIVFAGQYGPATRVTGPRFQQSLRTLLTPAQVKRFDEASREHLQRVGELYAERAASVVAERLFLDRAAYESVLRAARRKIHYRSDGLFDFSRHTNGFTYRALTMFVQSLGEDVLPKPYVRYWCHLREAGRPVQVNPVVIGDGKPVEAQLETAQTALRKQLTHAMTIRHQYLATVFKLDADQSRHLELAAKGATTRRLMAWRKKSASALRLHEANRIRKGQVISIVTNPPTPVDVAKEKIWVRAIEEILADAGSIKPDGYDQILNDGATAFVLGTLVRELFLSADRQARLRPLIAATHPEETPDQDLRELALVVRTMLRIHPDKLADLLDESQIVCWNLIRDSWTPQADFVSVLVPTATSNQFFVRIAPWF